MQLQFCLAWIRGGGHKPRIFKLESAQALFEEYVKRITKFVTCRVTGLEPLRNAKKPGSKIWVCERGFSAKTFSSEEVAENFKKLLDGGTRELSIVIGGPDGLTKEELDSFKPDLKWSFGPLTLPHELAAVVASEQIYRAWTILRQLPYHSAH